MNLTPKELAESLVKTVTSRGGIYEESIRAEVGGRSPENYALVHYEVDGDRVGNYWNSQTYYHGLPRETIQEVVHLVNKRKT